jgi:formate dehydrogenase major subunit
VWWDEEKREWTGLDIPDFDRTDLPPDAKVDLRRGRGLEALGGARPFTLHADGLGWLYAPSGLKNGPLPTHYEPLESLFNNPVYGQEIDPAAQNQGKSGGGNRWVRSND